MTFVKLGEEIPLFVVLNDGSEDKVVKADLISLNPYAVLETEVELAHAGSGYYANEETLMLNLRHVRAIYSVFDTDGTTLLAKAEADFQLERIDLACGEELIGFVEDDLIVGEIICN